MSIVVQRGKFIEQIFEFINKTGDEQVIVEVEKDAKFKGIILISQMNECNISFEVRVHEGGQADLYALAQGLDKSDEASPKNAILLARGCIVVVQKRPVIWQAAIRN